MNPTTSNEIRQAFLDYFQEMGHQVVPSSPLPQTDNPTLLFTNAGMNQFADVFLGKETRPYLRAVTAQKVMRVQGKHNDLENVGPSPRHHTFFEMLGNFSFGDYFKADAIRYAYEFITAVCGVSEERLVYTVHEDDEEAYQIWVGQIGVDAERVLKMGDKTNFWMMGDVGPCGPTSELHYDWGPENCSCDEPQCGVMLDNDCDRWLELWNLVFMQFNQSEDGSRTPLPKPGVDTGLGLERITSVVQQTPMNYDNDLFVALMDRIQQLLDHSRSDREERGVGYRVIADHARAAAFLLADGVMPGNVGAGYVLRMIIRRAARFGRKIGFNGPFLAQMATVVIENMGEAYPELVQRQAHVLQTVTREEERFGRTLDSALVRFADIIQELRQEEGREISGELAFNLYATHGLPLEITRDVAQERGYTVDEAGFEAARDAHAAASGAGAFGQYEAEGGLYGALLSELIGSGRLEEGGVDYDPYSGPESESAIVALLVDGQRVQRAAAGDTVEIVTAATPFYVEAGGEVSDTGSMQTSLPLGRIRVVDVRQPVAGLVVHEGEVASGEIESGQIARLQVDDGRRQEIRRNHTATHILHKELRSQLGAHVLQAGSLVAPDRLRFDFTHGQAVGKEALRSIESEINKTILANLQVNIRFMGQREAIASGAMALFGEKYGDVVRTIRIGRRGENAPYSFELCGGLHVSETAEIGLFRFISEGAVAAGVRRVEAVTGMGAYALVNERLELLEHAAQVATVPIYELPTRVKTLLDENRDYQKQISEIKRKAARGQFERLAAEVRQVEGVNVLAAQVEVGSAEGLREMADWFRDKMGSGVAVFATVSQGKPLLVATVTEDLIKKGVKAGDIVREVAKVVGGGGGGRPNLAQAGGRDIEKLPEALAIVPGLVEKALTG
jgi:alanyl-tRNA synthetase